MAARNGKQNRSAKTGTVQKKRGQRKKKSKCANILHVMLSVFFVFVFLILVTYALVLNMDFFYTHGTAVTVNSSKLTAADYNFYFYRAYYEFLNKMGSTTGGFSIDVKPDDSIPLNRQIAYTDETGDVTWLDFFTTRAEMLINRTYTYYAMAQETGFTLSREQEYEIDYDFEEKVWFEAEEVNQVPVSQYLRSLYGKGMNEAIYKRNLRILYTANFYEEYYKNTIEIPNEDLDAAYEKNADEYAIAFYRIFYLSGKAENAAGQPAKMQLAKQRAEELAAKVTDEESFVALCEEYRQYNDENSFWQKASVPERQQIGHCMTYFRAWLAEAGRQAGDIKVQEAANGYFIIRFESRNNNNYPVVDLKYFTISADDGFVAAEEKARLFMQEWRQGEQTADSFFEIAKEYRDIDYALQNHKIDVISYDDLNMGNLPLCMTNWCYGVQRSVGDAQIFTSEEEGCVYVAYFDGYGQLSRRSIAYTALREPLFEQWKDEVLGSDLMEEKFFYFLTTKK